MVAYRFILFLSFILILSSCYKDKEGCTDINAINFDAEADVNCCCNYPTLKINNSVIIDSVRFGKDSIFSDVNGRLYHINNFILGNYDIHTSGSQIYSEQIRLRNDRIVELPIIHMISPDFSSTTLKEIKSASSISGLTFSIGLPDELNQNVSYEDVPSDYILDKYEVLYDSTQAVWYDGMIEIYPDTSAQNKYRLYLQDLEIDVNSTSEFYSEIGKNLEITVQLDVSKLIQNLSINQSREEQEQIITTNIKESLSIIE